MRQSKLNTKILIKKAFMPEITQIDGASSLGWLYAAVEAGLRFVKSPRRSLMGEGTLEHFASEELLDEGIGIEKAMEVTERVVSNHLVLTQSPRFMGHMTSSIHFSSHMADILMSFFNQNVVKQETAHGASDIEKQTIHWVHRLIYQNDEKYYVDAAKDYSHSLGSTVSGGTLGNITALTVARNIRFPEFKVKGWTSLYSEQRRVVILASKRAHYSLLKAASLLGMGEESVEVIPVHPHTNKVNLELMSARAEELSREGAIILAVVGVAGSTETGSIDDLVSLSKIAKRYDSWFHVDGAWGGAYIFSQALSPLLRGIALADSVVIDGHKLLGLTMGHGMVVFKEKESLDAILHHAHYIVRTTSRDLGRFTLEGSRPFNAFKLWFTGKSIGRGGIARRVEQAHNNAKVFEKCLLAYDCFQLTSALETTILTYRYLPAWVELLKLEEDSKLRMWLHDTLNLVNQEIQEIGRREAPGFISRTVLESVAGAHGLVTVFRAIPIHSSTTESHIHTLLRWQKSKGDELFTKYFKKSPFEGVIRRK
jgi:putative pyridoxal-dependent aspartate 1-decarboxylase